MKHAFIKAEIFDGHQFHKQDALLVENKRIIGFVNISDIPSEYKIIELDKGILAPGFIDLQVNGGGVLFNNSRSVSGLEKITQAHLAFGTTSIMPTVISDTPNVVKECVSAVRQAIKENTSLLGIHIEGPFFNLNRRGVHEPSHIRPPDDSDIEYLSSISDIPVMLTIAPEKLNTQQISALSSSGIILLAGHTEASYDTIVQAVNNGLSGFTHLYNAMGPATARDPNTMGAALCLDQTVASIIADGYHVHPEMVKLAYRCKPKGKLIFVSDAMASIGSCTQFQLYNQIIHKKNGFLTNAENTLAGSAITLIDAVKFAVKQVQIPMRDALCMASLYPARYLSVDQHLGQLKAGCYADLVHFNSDFQVQNVWKSGIPLKAI